MPYMTFGDAPYLIVDGRRHWREYPPAERYWAVGSQPATKAHRIIGEQPGNDAVRTACGTSICLHAEMDEERWPFPAGGMSFEAIEEIPATYTLCLKCLLADETVT